MPDATSCTRCGVTIQPTTAQRTDGLCIPCERGTRESVEASKQWYRDEREREATDPFRKLWKTLASRVHGSEGVDGLSAAERSYFAVGVLDGEVYNGGFDQYFFNSSGALYSDAERGLTAIGALSRLQLLHAAKVAIFGGDEVPTGIAERRERLRQLPPTVSTQLDQLDQAYWEDPDGLAARLEVFARHQGLVDGAA